MRGIRWLAVLSLPFAGACEGLDEAALLAAIEAAGSLEVTERPPHVAGALAALAPPALGAHLAAFAAGQPPPPPTEAVTALWTAVCPDLPLASTPPDRVRAACLPEAGDGRWATGDPTVALLATAWLREQEASDVVVDAVQGALLGDPLITGDAGAALPALDGSPAPLPVAVTHRLDAAGLHGGDALLAPLSAGRFVGRGTGWALDGVPAHPDPILLVDPGVPAQALIRTVASLGPTRLLGQAGGHPTVVEVRVDDTEPLTAELRADGVALLTDAGLVSPEAGCPETGPTLCRDPLGSWLDAAGHGAVALWSDGSAATLAEAAAALEGVRVSLSTRFAPCVEGPSGTRCVPGGTARTGGADPADPPERLRVISTFWLDEREVVADDYRRCLEAGFCGPAGALPRDGALPVSGLTWRDAHRYCAWTGLRLPTEWEWEKAARGPAGAPWPWGDAPPDCERANAGCGKGVRPAGPAARHGLRDMVGNVAEWTGTWVEPGPCGASCGGVDPLGHCDGTWPCKTSDHKVVRGGSWRSTPAATDPARRTPTGIWVGRDVGVRCAAGDPRRRAFPSAQLGHPWPALPDPPPPAEAHRALAAAIAHDDLDDKGICGEDIRQGWKEDLRKGGRSTMECRDPYSYVTTNELRTHTFAPYIRNIGGAYVGIGSTQNYDLIAVAHPEWAWVVDYDPNVVRLHRVDRALVLASPTREAFVARWAADAVAESQDVVAAHYGDDPEVAAYNAVLAGYRGRLERHYTRRLTGAHEDPTFGWLATDAGYATIRRMLEQGRLVPVGGDLLAEGAMQSIGRQARALGTTVRVYYTSNAPTAWGGEVTPAYRANVRSLPFDARTVVLATYNDGAFDQEDYWHYSVADGRLIQRRLGLDGYRNMWRLVWDRIPTDDGDVTVCGVPGPDP